MWCIARLTRWRRLAAQRWPEAADLLVIDGQGRYAVISWCAGLSVHCFDKQADAVDELAIIGAYGCGHACRPPGDHELVDLAAGPATAPPGRLPRRMAHLSGCHVCLHVFDGLAATAAAQRGS
jgi:hypothetical protein